MKEEEKNVHLKFQKFSNNINDISNFLEKYTDGVSSKIMQDGKVDIVSYKKEDKIIRNNILERILLDTYKNKINLVTSKHMEIMEDVIFSSKANAMIDLPLDYIFYKTYNYFYISKKEEQLEYKYKIEKKVILPNKKKIELVEFCNLTNNDVIYLNSEEIALPIYVRCKKENDKILIKGMENYKKVKDIFINEKIPKHLRDEYPIVVDANEEIIWIPGLKKSHFDRQKDQKYDIILKYD